MHFSDAQKKARTVLYFKEMSSPILFDPVNASLIPLKVLMVCSLNCLVLSCRLAEHSFNPRSLLQIKEFRTDVHAVILQTKKTYQLDVIVCLIYFSRRSGSSHIVIMGKHMID